MSVPNAALHMACAMWLVDKATTLDPVQQIWMRTRLQRPEPFTTTELARLREPLLAWARAMDTRFAAVIEGCLDGTAPYAPGMGGLDLLSQYPGNAAREEAAALADATRTRTEDPEPKGALL